MILQKFSPAVIQAIGHYVYLLIDPFDGEVFYVGKGVGNRVFTHLIEEGETEKNQRIEDIRANGEEPEIEILAHGLPSDEVACQVEAAAIDLLGLDTLTNQIRGWGSVKFGRMSVKQIIAQYDPVKVLIAEPSILIRINQLYYYGMDEIELYDATRGIWKVGERREKVEYAFAVYKGIVQEVYKIEHWFPAGSTFSTRGLTDPDRWEFVGRRAKASIRNKYYLKSVDDYFSGNSQNPITYVNC